MIILTVVGVLLIYKVSGLACGNPYSNKQCIRVLGVSGYGGLSGYDVCVY